MDRGEACDGICERTACTTLLLGLGGLVEPEVGGESEWKLGVKGEGGVSGKAGGWGRAPQVQNQRVRMSTSHCIVGLACTIKLSLQMAAGRETVTYNERTGTFLFGNAQKQERRYRGQPSAI